MTRYYGIPNVKRETVIDGIRQTYDACSDGNLEDAIKFYEKRYTYIGSSLEMYIDGVSQEPTRLYHFFNLKSHTNDPLNP